MFINKYVVTNIIFMSHRVVVWVILYLLEHAGKDFQSEIFLVTLRCTPLSRQLLNRDYHGN